MVMRSVASDLEYWLALARAPGAGNVSLTALVEREPHPEALFEASTGRLESAGLPAATRRWLRQPDWDAVEGDLRWLEGEGRSLIVIGGAGYPERLARTQGAPLVLFVIGDVEALDVPQLAMVGARSATPQGLETARAFARHLAACGLGIGSGLAAGIDTASHRGALDAEGTTVAVLGTGPDEVYPRENTALFEEIPAAGGAIVTEFPPGTPPRKENFPQRNRIISGLSLGTLVVEATQHSGSLITARLASEQGREVFAIPGSIHNPMARGCHQLIRQGAKLVETADDILEELGPALRELLSEDHAQGGATLTQEALSASTDKDPLGGLDPEYAGLLEAMGDAPVSIDSVVERTALTADSVSSMLLLMELHGLVKPVSGGRYMRLTKGS